MIRLSLIIPTHNRSERLIAALESVIRQDLPAADWECVVVSNNSTDDTVARFGDFAARYPGLNLRLVTEDGPGVSYARNRGIAETSAPLLVFIDDDERINPGFLRAYADFFDAHPDAVVAGGRIIAEYVTGRPAWLSKYTEMCGRFLPAGCRAAATWRSGVRRPCATGASTLRWGVSDGC